MYWGLEGTVSTQGPEGHQEAPRGVGAIRDALGLAGSVGAKGSAGV